MPAAAPPPPERRVTVADITAQYPIGRRSVYSWIKTGRLHAWRFGGRILILDRDEVEAQLSPKQVA